MDYSNYSGIPENYGGRMLSAGLGLKVFTQDECDRIHQLSLNVLEKIGIYMESEEGLEYFDAAGCHVDKAKKIVKIPAYVAEEALRKAPSSFTLYDRYGNEKMILEDYRTHFVTFGEAVTTIDFYSRKRRPSTKQDAADIARVVESLDHIDGYIPPLHCCEIDWQSATLHCYEALFNYSTKPIYGWGDNPKQAEIEIEMASAIVGGRDVLREKPTLIAGIAPISPLKFPADGTDPLINYAKAGLPVGCFPNALAGGTTPAPFAGTIVDANAEILALNVMFQAITPGCPFIYCASSTMLDPRCALAVVGSPELALIGAGLATMARYYKLPCTLAGG